HGICQDGLTAHGGYAGKPFAASDSAAQKIRSVTCLRLHDELVLLRVQHFNPRQVAIEGAPDLPTNTVKKLIRIEDRSCFLRQLIQERQMARASSLPLEKPGVLYRTRGLVGKNLHQLKLFLIDGVLALD